MKASKGKDFIYPDENWEISEQKFLKNNHGNPKKFLIKQFNKKIRKLFKRIIKKEMENE